MSPAMLDLRSPVSSSSKLQHSRRGSQGDAFSSSCSILFYPSGILESYSTMDRANLGHEVPSSSFSFPLPSIYSFSASTDQAVATGIARARFSRQRKHCAVSRARPASSVHDNDGGAGPGLKPFQSEMPEWAPDDETENRETESVQEQLYGWKPFVPDASGLNVSSCSTGAGPGSIQGRGFGFGNPTSSNTSTGVFVFGSGMNKEVSSLSGSFSQNLSAGRLRSAESSKSEGLEHIFGMGTFSDSSRKGVETELMFAGSSSSAGENNKLSALDVVVGGSNAKHHGNLCQHSSMDSNSGSFYELKSRIPIPENKEEIKSSYSNRNFSFGSGEGLLSKHLDRTVKMDHQDTSNGNIQRNAISYSCGNFVKTKLNSDENSWSMLHEDLRKLKIENSVTEGYDNKGSDVFVFGSGMKNNSHAGKGSSHDVSHCKLPEEMYRLHLENSSDEICADTHSFSFRRGLKKDAPLRPTTAMGIDDTDFSMLPESIKKMNINSSSNEDHRNDSRGAFVFNSGVKQSASSGKSASLHFDDSYICKLPDEIGKMKLNGFEDESLKTTKGDSWPKHEKNLHFDLAGTSSTTTSVGISIQEIGEKVKELKVDSGVTFPNTCNGSDDDKLGGFAVKTNANVSLSAAETSNMPSTVFCKMSSNCQDETLKFTFDSNDHNLFFGKIREPALGQKGENVADDTFGTTCSSSSYLSENAVHSTHCDLKRGDLTGKIGHACPPHRSVLDAYGSSNCDLQSGDDRASCPVPLQAHNSCGFSAETSSFPSQVPTVQSSGVDLSSNSMHTVLETSGMEFRSEKHGTSFLPEEDCSAEPCMDMTFDKNAGYSKGVRLKKKRAKSRKSTPVQSGTPKQFVPVDKVPEENLEEDPLSRYSPMDYSPYQEMLASKQEDTIEAYAASIDSIPFDLTDASTDTRRSPSIDGKGEETVPEDNSFDRCGLGKHTGAGSYGSEVLSASDFTSDVSLIDEFASGPRKESLKFKDEIVFPGITSRTSMSSGSFSFGSNIEQTTGDEFNFQFAASSSTHRSNRRKNMVKGGQDLRSNFMKVPTASTMSNLFLFSKSHVATGSEQEQKGSDEKREGKINETRPNEGLTPAAAAASFAAREACEKCRLRGNEAYADGNLSKAEEYYSQGINLISLKDISNICSGALKLCYNNRAATRMSLGRLREALCDCKMALSIDPSFLRARVRAGNIHLSLGETTDALQHFQKCLELDCKENSDKNILLKATDGIEKAQRLNDLIDQSSISLNESMQSDPAKLLDIVSEALSISPHSESMLELKAKALLLLRNYDEAIEICKQAIEFAENNAVAGEADCQIKGYNCSDFMERSYVRLWSIIAKSYFYLGKLNEADELLQKCEKVNLVTEKFSESLISFAVNIRELLRLKVAGNEAFQAGRHLEAVDFYSSALALNTESRPFTAICLCNRAAAYQALSQITDAIADCSLAIALDPTYRKAFSRRATLHEMIRDYGQAAADLHKLISLLEMSSHDNCNASETLQSSTSNISELHQARCRLSTSKEEALKGASLDMYMILGIERSSSAAQLKKAYRKAALRHHPDKAGQLLTRSDNNDDRVWKEVAKEVCVDADRLFKMIGEAYAILGDPSKRLQYDAEEELRITKKGYAESSSHKTSSSGYHWQHKQSVEQQRSWRRFRSSPWG